jgi:hypothetical protein
MGSISTPNNEVQDTRAACTTTVAVESWTFVASIRGFLHGFRDLLATNLTSFIHVVIDRANVSSNIDVTWSLVHLRQAMYRAIYIHICRSFLLERTSSSDSKPHTDRERCLSIISQITESNNRQETCFNNIATPSATPKETPTNPKYAHETDYLDGVVHDLFGESH